MSENLPAPIRLALLVGGLALAAPGVVEAQDNERSRAAIAPSLGVWLGDGTLSFLPTLTGVLRFSDVDAYATASGRSTTAWLLESGVSIRMKRDRPGGLHFGIGLALSTLADETVAVGAGARLGFEEPLSTTTAFQLDLRGYGTTHDAAIQVFSILSAGIQFDL